METRANNVLVGAFVLAGFALALGLLVWIARSSDGASGWVMASVWRRATGASRSS